MAVTEENPDKQAYQSDTLMLRYRHTPDLLEELKKLSAAKPNDQSKIELILSELQLRGQNHDAAALIASIDQQRREIANDVAEMTETLKKRGSKN